ncbi:bifunctional adenosylcobinamide kinase/adenosylcobinamide-phosphate guanylyltransferase [Cytobacillus kochii]|uniref:bifunctional adenosylcobinamide kinase/adenosylcobinamide-phosphate guanylyltransferase n=1 Tax=Cytobacillus kochii TaxID=859143 RepID=UPI0025A020DA|nr:bifunctional adenosylcobinamide kinase/adenosylcobinamide-phosphate guanylyltransferase [Cytobacillus kochii]MDM5205890.1 bifunctional adenosylcobinamide kinase/adenosylcobinamide-phosphate guanylyltransferase [Cytobacillus kochii]
MARIIFISGGVRSGKSQLAEKLAIDRAHYHGKQLHYIATAQPSDKEMVLRIKHHQKHRQESGMKWMTWEQPRNVHQLATHYSSNDIILLDCLTTLLNNEFFYENRWSDYEFQQQIFKNLVQGIKELSSKVDTLILVSNEIFHDVISDEPLVLVYGKMLGRLHQKIVALADEAYLVDAGCLIQMKGGEEYERLNGRWNSL